MRRSGRKSARNSSGSPILPISLQRSETSARNMSASWQLLEQPKSTRSKSRKCSHPIGSRIYEERLRTSSARPSTTWRYYETQLKTSRRYFPTGSCSRAMRFWLHRRSMGRSTTRLAQRAARDGVTIRQFHHPAPVASMHSIVDAVARAMTPRTHLVMIGHIVLFGVINPVRDIADAVHARTRSYWWTCSWHWAYTNGRECDGLRFLRRGISQARPCWLLIGDCA